MPGESVVAVTPTSPAQSAPASPGLENPFRQFPHFCRSSLPTTEKGDVKPRLLKQADSKAIADIKALAQMPLGIEPKAPIGEHAVTPRERSYFEIQKNLPVLDLSENKHEQSLLIKNAKQKHQKD